MDKTEWLKKYASFQGAVQQVVADDVWEHGTPTAHRDYTMRDLRQLAVQTAAHAFELYCAIDAVQAAMGTALAGIGQANEAARQAAEAIPAARLVFPDDVRWADTDPFDRDDS